MKIVKFILVVLFFIHLSNSQTWVQSLNGISMWSLGKDLSGNVYAGASGTVKSIFKSTNRGTSWDTVLSGSTSNFLYIACDSSNGVYAANVSNGLMKSTNSGGNWVNIPPGTFGSSSVQSVICGKIGYVYVGTITGGIYRSTNNGSTFPDNTLSGLTIVSLAVDRSNSNIIYAGASSGSPPNYGFYRSTDAGTTWSSNLNPLNIWGIVQRPDNSIYTITTSSPYSFDKSTNSGLNWTTLTTFSGAMRGLCFSGLLNYFYSSGNGGVFISTNGGQSFNNFNFTYSSNQIINAPGSNPPSYILVAVSGTTNGGVWKYEEPWFGINQINNEIPDKFELLQNYPNPFNPVTKIKFNIPSERGQNTWNVRLDIYDITGKAVVNLINVQLKPGEYEIVWDASIYPSGVYFCILTAGDIAEIKKMILVK